MKSGTTRWHRINPGVDLTLIDEIIITYKSMPGYGSRILLQRRYPSETQMRNGEILVPLSQADTALLREQGGEVVQMELQYNFISKAVDKSEIRTIHIGNTLATEYVDGSAPDDAQIDGKPISFEAGEVIAINSGGQCVKDWNENDPTSDKYIENRTHYDSRKEGTVEYTFDGDISSKEYIALDEYSGMVKIADDFPDISSLTKIEITYRWLEDDEWHEEIRSSENIFDEVHEENGIYNIYGVTLFVSKDFDMGNGVIVPKGYYFLYGGDEGYTAKASVSYSVGELKKLDKKYLPDDIATLEQVEAAQTAADNKMDKANPSGTGSFSMNRKSGTSIGTSSFAEGYNATASGYASHAEGRNTKATAGYTHVEGYETEASAEGAHAEGSYSKAKGAHSHAEGYSCETTSPYCHAEGEGTKAPAASGSHAQGRYNYSYLVNTQLKLAHVVGNGTSDSNRSDAHTLDFDGNAWFAGDVYVGSTSGMYKDSGSKKLATEDYVNTLYMKLNSNTVLGFYCIEDVTIVINGVSKLYPANSNVEVTFTEGDVFEIVPTSDNSILALTAFPGALGTYYSWLEGVRQFSNILFDMNAEEFYSKWSQGNQGLYQVQFAQYTNCIFWSDNPYINDTAKRTNYVLYYTSQLPLCYSSIPDNTFKAFYMALNVNSDPNWGNLAYRDSFAKATWATQAFSYYGARTIGIPGMDDPSFNIPLPADCRGLMFYSDIVENAGTFDAINTTNFGAKSGSWRDAFGYCSSLRNLYIKNLKVNLNISWSPIEYNSIYYIISEATNTNKITISVSPYTYYLLSSSDFELAASKNITIELLTTNYVEDKRLSDIANKADKSYVDDKFATIKDDIGERIVAPKDAVAGDLLIYDGTNWVKISKSDLIAEIIAALPNTGE